MFLCLLTATCWESLMPTWVYHHMPAFHSIDTPEEASGSVMGRVHGLESNEPYQLAILAVHRDQAATTHFLLEWAEYHISREVDHIYLILHQTRQMRVSPAMVALATVISEGFVTIIIKVAEDFKQKEMYRQMMLQVQSRFLAVIDTDEFLVSTSPQKTAGSLFKSELLQCDKVMLPSIMFLSNSSETPQSILASNVWRLPLNVSKKVRIKFSINYKHILRVSALAGALDIHDSKLVPGSQTCQRHKQRMDIVLFHYRVRSKHDWYFKRQNFLNTWRRQERFSGHIWSKSDAEEHEHALSKLVAKATCRDTFLAGTSKFLEKEWGAQPGDTQRCFGANAARKHS